MINVTKTYLPPMEEYTKYLEKIWQSGWVTNSGPLVNELQQNLKDHLGIQHIRFLNNGTIALQIAIKAAGATGEVITTPFSYVATTSSIAWEQCKPVFADIDPVHLTLDPKKIEPLINDKTTAILATHVYGNPCDVEGIEAIAKKYNLKVIYDAAHCFGVRYKGKSILNYGDFSTLSFHATKLFHTIEGGAVVANLPEDDHKVSYMLNFGHKTPESFQGVGVNGKPSEFNAAMGLCLLPRVSQFIEVRKSLSELYESILFDKKHSLTKPKVRENTEYNYSYYPVIFPSEEILLKVISKLNQNDINPRRYFYPSLSQLDYVDKYDTPVSDDISRRILCLPLYYELSEENVKNIAELVLSQI